MYPRNLTVTKILQKLHYFSCPSSHPSRLHSLPPSAEEVAPEIDDVITVEGEWCEICWGAIDWECEDRVRLCFGHPLFPYQCEISWADQ